jgi:hypothetical protein
MRPWESVPRKGKRALLHPPPGKPRTSCAFCGRIERARFIIDDRPKVLSRIIFLFPYGDEILKHGLREAVGAFVLDRLDPSTFCSPEDIVPIQSIRLPSFLELLQNGDVSDDERIIMEDELFKTWVSGSVQLDW